MCYDRWFYLSFLLSIRAYQYLDGMFVCVRDAANVGLINNTITSIKLPKLHRAYVSMHQLCGTNVPADGSNAIDCAVKAGIYTLTNPIEQEFNTKIFYEFQADKLVNDGSLINIREWFYSNIKLPFTSNGQRLRLMASFDTKHGGFGLDNVHLHTPQM